MTHLDEGTIHAWLDGALDAEQSRAVESHVQGCRQCGDAVAEARGLVAASTRILGALDDAPARVIPAQPSPATKRRPMWRAAPWVTGIAAVLVAAVVLRTGQSPRNAPQEAVASARLADRAVETALPAPPTVSAQKATPAATAPVGRVASAPSAGAGVSNQVRPAPAAVGSVAGATAPQDQPSAVASRSERAFVGEEARASRRATDLASESRERRDAAASRATEQMQQQVVAAPPSALAAPAAPAPAPTCYVVNLPGQVEARASQFTASAARQRAAQRSDATAAPAAAMAERGASTIVRLDTLAAPIGRVLRMARSDSSVGWWRALGGDTIRVELVGFGFMNVTAAQRVPCPPQE